MIMTIFGETLMQCANVGCIIKMFPHPISSKRLFVCLLFNGQLGAESSLLLLDAETAKLSFFDGVEK